MEIDKVKIFLGKAGQSDQLHSAVLPPGVWFGPDPVTVSGKPDFTCKNTGLWRWEKKCCVPWG